MRFFFKNWSELDFIFLKKGVEMNESKAFFKVKQQHNILNLTPNWKEYVNNLTKTTLKIEGLERKSAPYFWA